MPVLIGLLVIAGIGALLYFHSRKTRAGGGDERDLLQLCRGDREQMERLIAHELRRAPSQWRSTAVANAIHAIRRDNS